MESLDNNFGKNPNTPLVKPAIGYAIVFGLVGIALFLIGYYAHIPEDNWTWKIVGWAVTIGLMYWMIKDFRDKKNGGYLRLGQGVGLSVLVGLFSSILTGIVLYVFMTAIAPEYMTHIQDQAIINMENQGLSEEQIRQSMQITDKIMTPGTIVFFGMIGSAIFYLILGLIFSAIFKRD